MKIDGVFFDVRLKGHEVFVDERRDFPVSVGFGFQPNACASSRGGAEINEQWFLCRLSLGQGCVCILFPLHSHFVCPPELEISRRQLSKP
jgi:hypothetical protein